MQITPTPSSAAVVSVRLCGSEDALVEVRGTVDDAACDRAGLLLGAALDAGAVRLIVDLAAASQVPMTFMDALSSARDELHCRHRGRGHRGPCQGSRPAVAALSGRIFILGSAPSAFEAPFHKSACHHRGSSPNQ
jgi:hypothetical protein